MRSSTPRTGRRTEVVRSETVALLRPDLVVASVQAPAQTLSVRPVDVRAEIVEQNGDVGAKATATLSWGPSVLATQQVDVAAGGTTTVVFANVALTTPVPVESDRPRRGRRRRARRMRRTTTDPRAVDVTEHELARSRLVLDHLGGYGTQFNHHVFAAITVAPPGTIAGLEPKVKALEPQIVRIFFNDRDESTLFPDRLASFIDVVRMANETGAKINITYQTAVAHAEPRPVHGAVRRGARGPREDPRLHEHPLGHDPERAEPRGESSRWTSTRRCNRSLHAELVSRGLRDQIGIMVGDLVEADVSGNHRQWMTYITTNMLDIVDAYSEHIYWNYWDIPRMEFRLRDVHKLMFEELPPNARRPCI